MHFRSERLLALRNARGWTQGDLGQRAGGIRHTTVGKYERNGESPGADNLIAIAMALDTTTDFLLGLSDDPKRLTAREKAVIAAMREYD